MFRPARFLRILLLIAVVLTGLFGAALASSTAADARVATDSVIHGASYPVWYPLRTSYAMMDCATDNPGCTGAKMHGNNSMSILSRRMDGNTPVYTAQPVYAAGAGILHIGANVGDRCLAVNGMGTWIWIDHGHGVISRYGHLAGIKAGIHNGMFVTPATVIGYTGHSGERIGGDCTRATHYLNFQIMHGGLWGPAQKLSTLLVCQGTHVATWPSAINRSFRTWQYVPQKQVLDNTGQSATSCSHWSN